MNGPTPVEPRRLGTVLDGVEELPWNYAVYLAPSSEKWDENAECLVLDPDDVVDEKAGVPEAARLRGFKYVIGVSTLQDVVMRVRESQPAAGAETLLRAFLYYYTHDAFIEM